MILPNSSRNSETEAVRDLAEFLRSLADTLTSKGLPLVSLDHTINVEKKGFAPGTVGLTLNIDLAVVSTSYGRAAIYGALGKLAPKPKSPPLDDDPREKKQ